MPVTSPRPRLILICLASLGWAFSFGLGATLASLWLRDAGSSARTIGLNTSVYYLGVALASPMIPWLMRRANRSCVVTGMLLDAITTALFPWCHGVAVWHLLRFVGGIGTALSLIPMETLVNHNAPSDRRARDFGIYAVSVASGIALGSVIGLVLYPLSPHLAFTLGGAVTLLAAALSWVVLPETCLHSEESSHAPLPVRAGVLGFGTAWVQGFLEGVMLTFLSIYLLGRGFSEEGTGVLMGGLFLGVILAQLPVAWLADRLGRLRILLVCHACVLAGLLLLPRTTSLPAVACWLFVLGACCGALYPLGLALLGDRIPSAALARANAWYLASNCAGSLTGPVLVGQAIDLFGQGSQFVVSAAALILVLTAWLAAERTGRGRLPSSPSHIPSRRAA